VALIISNFFLPFLLPSFLSFYHLTYITEREQVTVTNVASTMITMMVNHPLADQADFSSLRVLSCGGSPQSPAVVSRAIALFGCEFFLSYGMTECCGKISMSILPEDAPERLTGEGQLNKIQKI
jgi:acyl-CoA synthetase (AMP-forming)/AMP-acid ligase II